MAGEQADDAKTAAEAGPLITRAAQLVIERGHWTKGKLARDRHSHPVSPSSERATRYCAGGALLRATSERYGINFRVGEVTEEPTKEPWVTPLALAYRYVGLAMWLLLLSATTRFSERKSGPGWLVKLESASPERVGPAKRAVEVSWSQFVHTVNDHARVKHSDIRLAFSLAHIYASAEARESARDELEGDS